MLGNRGFPEAQSHLCICQSLLPHDLCRGRSSLRWLPAVSNSATPWTVTCQAPLSVGFSRQEYWSGLPCPLLGDLPNPVIEPVSLTSPVLAGGFFTACTTWEALTCLKVPHNGARSGTVVCVHKRFMILFY